MNSYKKLPPLFEDWSEEQIEETISRLTGIADCGAALTAYGKLQYTDMPEEERLAIKQSLFTMVMIW